MLTVFGRDRELREIAAILSRAKGANAAVSMRVTGGSGIGKSALLTAALEGAAQTGWLCAPVASHRVQAHVPGAGLIQLIRSILDTLGDASGRYRAGIDAALRDAVAGELPTDALRTVFLRLTEGVLLDHPLLLALDDAQWFDAESGEAVEQALASYAARPLGLLAFDRTSEDAAFRFSAADEVFTLARLDESAAAAVARTHYPAASDAVVNAIVAHGGGHPIDIVALAESACENNVASPDDIEGSVRSAVARQLGRMDPRQREFLQLCALLSDPMEYEVLLQLWPDAREVDEMVQALCGRFLVAGSEGLRFVHSAVAESVRHTVAIEIPFRRRILNVLTARESPTLQDYERIVAQAALCGDKRLERQYLLKVANEAAKRGALSAAAAAYSRALEIALPGREEFVPFFMTFAGTLMVQNRMVEARELLERAMREALELGIETGLGPIVVALVVATGRTLGRAPALAACEFHLPRARDEADRLHVLSAYAWVQSLLLDAKRFDAIKGALLAIADPLPDVTAMRVLTAEAFLRTRCGEYARAVPLLDRALMHASSAPPAMRASPAIARVCIEFLQFGSRNFDNRISTVAAQSVRDVQQIGLIDYLRATSLLGTGDFQGAQEIASEALTRRMENPDRQRLLGISAAIAAWQGIESPHAPVIEEQLNAFYSGDQSDTLLPLATWWAMAIASKQPDQARALLTRSIPRLSEPFEMDALVFPVAAASAAVKLNDHELLRSVIACAGRAIDVSPWHQSQRLLATGYGAEMLQSGSGCAELRRAEALFTDLAYPFFSAVARVAVDPKDEMAAQILRRAGVRGFKPLKDTAVHAGAKKTGAATQHPSKRELEIIHLVSDGRTNRQIAEDLFLSERTVEAHLANVFNKLGVSSRTQVAAWFLTTTAG